MPHSTVTSDTLQHAPRASEPLPEQAMTPRHRALRRVATVWLVVALVEVALWWMLARSNFYRPLWKAPALLALVAGVGGTVHALRVRARDRRAGDRRQREQRGA